MDGRLLPDKTSRSASAEVARIEPSSTLRIEAERADNNPEIVSYFTIQASIQVRATEKNHHPDDLD